MFKRVEVDDKRVLVLLKKRDGVLIEKNEDEILQKKITSKTIHI